MSSVPGTSRPTLSNPPTWALLLASGLILGLAFPPNPVGLFGAVGLVPLLYALERAESWRDVFRWSYLSFLLFSALTSWWIGSWQAKTDPFLMISTTQLSIRNGSVFACQLPIHQLVSAEKITSDE